MNGFSIDRWKRKCWIWPRIWYVDFNEIITKAENLCGELNGFPWSVFLLTSWCLQCSHWIWGVVMHFLLNWKGYFQFKISKKKQTNIKPVKTTKTKHTYPGTERLLISALLLQNWQSRKSRKKRPDPTVQVAQLSRHTSSQFPSM